MSLPIPAQFPLTPVTGLLNGPVLSDSAPAVREDLDGDKSVLGEQGQMLMLAVRLWLWVGEFAACGRLSWLGQSRWSRRQAWLRCGGLRTATSWKASRGSPYR